MSSPVRDTGQGLYVAQQRSTDNNKDGSGKTMQSPSGSKQARRLQLRNAGFRGSSIPARKTSPTFIHTNSWSSNKAAMNSSSDIENVSPVPSRTNTPVTTGRRESGGILQEISNSTSTPQSKKTRQRLSSKAFQAADSAQQLIDLSPPASPPLTHFGVRKASVKGRPRIVHRRRSVSGEKIKYIEHLEVELAATQSQLSSSTSSATNTNKEHTVKIRNLNAEIKRLHEDLAGWETKYEERVQEEVTRHAIVESDLKARIRCLEQEIEEKKFRNQDLESHLELTTQNLQAVERANVQLEKRLEVLGELLASTKVDLHAETPGRERRHARPKSMLPRFPTASSLMSSPDRQPRTQPVSPLSTFGNGGNYLTGSPNQIALPMEDDINEHSDILSEVESIFSEHSVAADSMTSAENFEVPPVFNPWQAPPRPTNTAKPARRMRRFGAGSLGPKPLILPSTSNCEQFTPSSAPPLEHSRTTPAFFPDVFWASNDGCGSPIPNRRRASTISNEMLIHDGLSSTLLDLTENVSMEERVLNFESEHSFDSHATTKGYSSIGPLEGRSLMDELSALQFDENVESVGNGDNDAAVDDTIQDIDERPSEAMDNMSAFFDFDSLSTSLDSTPKTLSRRSSGSIQRFQHSSLNTSIPSTYHSSAFSRLRAIFGDIWRRPVAIARYLIQAAQARLQIPRPLLDVQWWLVGILIGPMAKRRLLGSTPNETSTERDVRLLGAPSTTDIGRRTTRRNAERAALQSSSPSVQSGVAFVTDRKRRDNGMRCIHHHSKHNPWLWIRFSITLAFAIGVAFKDGPGSLLDITRCRCREIRTSDEQEIH